MRELYFKVAHFTSLALFQWHSHQKVGHIGILVSYRVFNTIYSLYLSGRSRRQTYGNEGQPQGSGERRQNAEVEAMWTPITFVPFAPTTQCTAVPQQSVCPFAPRSQTPGLPAPDMMFCMMLSNQIRQAMMQYDRNRNDVSGFMTDPLMLNYQRFLTIWSYQQLLAVRQEAVNRGCPGVPPMPPRAHL